MLKPGQLARLSKYTCAYTPSTVRPDSGHAGFDPTFNWIEAFNYTRPDPFTLQTAGNRLIMGDRKLPHAGHLPTAAETLGLIEAETDVWASVLRGVRKHTIVSPIGRTRYTVWESANYHTKPGAALFLPKVVLIYVPGEFRTPFQLTNSSGSAPTPLEDLLDANYEYFDRKRLLVILDRSTNGAYTPYSYGVGLTTYDKPFVGTYLPDRINACELLVSYFYIADTTNITGGGDIENNRFNTDPTQVAYVSTFAAYWKQLAQIYHAGSPTGLPLTYPYNQFTDPAADVALWDASVDTYFRRKCVSHFQRFDESPVRFAAGTDDTTGEQILGAYGHGYGDGNAYFLATKPADFELGDDYVTNDTGPSTVNQLITPKTTTYADIAAKIMADITSFYGA